MSWEISVGLGVLFVFISLGFLALFFILPEWMGISKKIEVLSSQTPSHNQKQEGQLTNADPRNPSEIDSQKEKPTREKT
ncbi:MAG: hypothetical protein N2Z70_00835 [Bdellovibrionaceae bacterium]|jgi:hypothetical protein|nr:hypothetical protein [Pseudobdellovibrionaceae bacterium]